MTISTKDEAADAVLARMAYAANTSPQETRAAMDALQRTVENPPDFVSFYRRITDAGWPSPRRQPYRRSHPKVGRNEPCPCGSGKKYKRCCGNVPALSGTEEDFGEDEE